MRVHLCWRNSPISAECGAFISIATVVYFPTNKISRVTCGNCKRTKEYKRRKIAAEKRKR